jgi:hypothetical protein
VKINFWWYYDKSCFMQNQHTELDLYSASSMKLSSTSFTFVFQGCPIRTEYILDAVFWLASSWVLAQTFTQYFYEHIPEEATLYGM